MVSRVFLKTSMNLKSRRFHEWAVMMVAGLTPHETWTWRTTWACREMAAATAGAPGRFLAVRHRMAPVDEKARAVLIWSIAAAAFGMVEAVVDDTEGMDQTAQSDRQAVLQRAAAHRREWVWRRAGVAGMGMKAEVGLGGVGWVVALE